MFNEANAFRNQKECTKCVNNEIKKWSTRCLYAATSIIKGLAYRSLQEIGRYIEFY
jgi:hypothetical protein